MATIKIEAIDELLACRICLITDIKLWSIYEDRLDEAFSDIMGSQLSVGDGFPQHLCDTCRAQLQASSVLRARCLRAQEMLKQSLEHHHFITTEYIRSIDRAALNLTDDSKNDILCEPNTHDDFMDYKTDSDSPVLQIVEADIENLKLVQPDSDLVEVKILESLDELKGEIPTISQKKVKKEGRRKKRTDKKSVVIRVEDKPAVEWVAKKKHKRKKKGFKRYFMCDEDYIKFEEKYNIKVIRLSEEEQKREMEARKETENYAHALMRCEKCLKGFLSMLTYENHLKVHDPAQGPNECPLCFCRFKWPNNLRSHMIEGHQLKYVCNKCQRVIKGRDMALLHAQFHEGKTWQCKFCPRTFNKKSSFYTHMRMNHPPENLGSTCDICGETFKGASGLKLHKYKKCNKNGASSTAAATPPVPAETDTRTSFICEVCGYKCTSLSMLAPHLRRHSGDKPHACRACPARFSRLQSLEKHHRVIHLGLRERRPPVKCEICGKALAHAASLKLHVNSVHLKIPPPRRPPRQKRKIEDDLTIKI